MSEDNEIIDLSNLDTVAASEQPYKLELLHPTSKKQLGIFIYIRGIQSNTYRDIQDELTNERIREGLEAQKTGKDIVRTVQDSREINIKQVAFCVVNWENVKLDGLELPFNFSNTIKLFTRFPWIRQQVEEGMSELKNFMKG